MISAGYDALKSIEKADLRAFSDSEKEILEFVAQKADKDGGKNLLKIPHGEEAFKKLSLYTL